MGDAIQIVRYWKVTDMKVRAQVLWLIVAAAMFMTACGSVETSRAAPGSPDPAPDGQGNGTNSGTVFLSSAEVGLALVETPSEPVSTFDFESGRLISYEEAFAVLRKRLTNFRLWPPASYDSSFDKFQPLVEGDEALRVAVDRLYGRRNSRPETPDCWLVEPPVVIAQGAVAFGGAEQNVVQDVRQYRDSTASSLEMSSLTSARDSMGKPLLREDSGIDHRLVFTYGSGPIADQRSGTLGQKRCEEFGEGLVEPCNSIPTCLRNAEGTHVVARRGAWLINLRVAGELDAEKLLTIALSKVPSK